MDQDGPTTAIDSGLSLPPEFRVEELLGQGGAGLVYKAFYQPLQKHVAVKVLTATTSSDDVQESQRLLKEARALSALDHPNIVKILNVGMTNNGAPFLIYELLEGETLQTYLASGKKVPAKFLSMLFEQLCSALDFIHANNVVHRDIKPSNIMILSSESRSAIQVKLLDFGLAKDLGVTATANGASGTATALYKGSPAYMSPEQCKGVPVDLRSDIYSLACVLYECLLGKPPFQCESVYEVLYQHIHVEVLIPERKLSDKLKVLLKRALAKDPSARYASAEQFNAELQQALKSEIARPAHMSVRTGGLVALGLLLTAVAAFLALRPRDNEPVLKENKNDGPVSKASSVQVKAIGSSRPVYILQKLADESGQSHKAAACMKTIRKIDELIPKLRSPEELFIAYCIKADSQVEIANLDAAVASYQMALESAKVRTKNGKIPIEAAKPLVMLAEIKLEQNKISEAEPYVNEALSVFQQNGNECYLLKFPFDYGCMRRDIMFSSALSMKAEFDLRQKNMQAALIDEKAL